MTREEQLKFCSVCNHRKMDMKQGMLCGLTNAKADFDTACPNYDEDAKEKIKNERIEQEYQETLTVSGWLAFFLWIGVGIGAVWSVIFTIASLKDAGLTFSTSLIYFFYIGSLATTAVLTIKAFYQKAPNAVSLARTYIGMIAIDGCVSVANGIILNEDSMLVGAVRSFIWAAIWFSYISNSTHVANMIPKPTRVWKIPEKILLAIYTLACVIIVVGLTNFVNNPADSNFYQKDYIIDATIEATNKELPDYSNESVTQLKMYKEGRYIVYPYKINTITTMLEDATAWELSTVIKQEMLYETALGKDEPDVQKAMNMFFGCGYDICYRYLNVHSNVLYDIVITGEEYNHALIAGVNFQCDNNVYQDLVEYYRTALPSNYMGSASLINIHHSSTALSYYVQLPKLSALDLVYMDNEYLKNYVIDEWEGLDDHLKTLAKINQEDIVYRFYTAEGDEHCIVTITPEEYNAFNQ